MAKRLFTTWHMHLGKRGDPKAMSTFEIDCTPLWMWDISYRELTIQVEDWLTRYI